MSTSKMVKHAKHTSYLSRITFDPKLLQNRLAGYIGNIRIVFLLILTILFLGIINYLQLPRRLNPEIAIPIVNVVTVLPGASPEDIEKLVTIPLENEIKNLAGLDQMTSTSTENVSVITMQFLSTVNRDKAEDDVSSAVKNVNDLPEEAQAPSVKAFDFEDVPIWTFALRSTQNDVSSLQTVAELLKEQLENTPKIDRVNLVGEETQEVSVEVLPENSKQININPVLLSQSIRSALNSYPAGTVVSSRNSFSLTLDPSVTSVADIRDTILNIDKSRVRLGDVAIVSLKSKPAPRLAYIADSSNPAAQIVTFDVYKTRISGIDEGFKAAKTTVEKSLSQYGDRFAVTTIRNTAEEIDTQFYDLLGEFRSTILLVFGCLFLFLGFRQAVISSITIPLTFLSAFIFMRYFGMSINFLSLFAFLLTLGLLVDDTIVVVSAMTTYFKTGKFTPLQTGVLVWRDTIVPIWSTTITTIWSFIPLLLSTGIIGEFIKPIPIVVTITMISSTAIAVLITLPFMVVLLKPKIAHRVVVFIKILVWLILLFTLISLSSGNSFIGLIVVLYLFLTLVTYLVFPALVKLFQKQLMRKKVQNRFAYVKHLSDHGLIDLEKIAASYYRLIYRILSSKNSRKKVVVGIMVYAFLSFTLLPLGLVKSEFFPKSDSEILFATLELPRGTRFEETVAKNNEFINELRSTPYTSFVVSQIDTGLSLTNGTPENTSGSILYTFHLPKDKDRPISSIEIAQKIREKYASFSGGKVRVIEESGGPPAGSDLQLKLSGPDLKLLGDFADTVAAYLTSEPGIQNVEKSIKVGTSALVFVPDSAALAQYEISRDQLGLFLRTFATGFTLDEANIAQNTSEKQDIVLRFSKDLASVNDISRLVFPTQTGQIPLLSLGEIHTKTNPTVITRENGKRTIFVSASVGAGYNIPDKNKKMEEFAKNLQMPEGFSWGTGGVNEENQKSVQSILQAMVVSFILIMVTMVLQFQSYRQAAIVLIVIPLAVSSVFAFFALTGTPLSFPALIGVLSLFGIVVTNSMFIVDKINLNLKEGMEFKEAIADAGSSRLEPIVLTKLCTVLGLLPITIADPLWRGLGGAIISGILLASTIMLLFIPVVYFEIFAPSSYKSK